MKIITSQKMTRLLKNEGVQTVYEGIYWIPSIERFTFGMSYAGIESSYALHETLSAAITDKRGFFSPQLAKTAETWELENLYN